MKTHLSIPASMI